MGRWDNSRFWIDALVCIKKQTTRTCGCLCWCEIKRPSIPDLSVSLKQTTTVLRYATLVSKRRRSTKHQGGFGERFIFFPLHKKVRSLQQRCKRRVFSVFSVDGQRRLEVCALLQFVSDWTPGRVLFEAFFCSFFSSFYRLFSGLEPNWLTWFSISPDQAWLSGVGRICGRAVILYGRFWLSYRLHRNSSYHRVQRTVLFVRGPLAQWSQLWLRWDWQF